MNQDLRKLVDGFRLVDIKVKNVPQSIPQSIRGISFHVLHKVDQLFKKMLALNVGSQFWNPTAQRIRIVQHAVLVTFTQVMKCTDEP